MDYTKFNQGSLSGANTKIDEGLRSFFLNVYKMMGMGLLITAIVAFFTANSPLFAYIHGTPLALVVALAPLGIVFFMNFKINSMSNQSAYTLFMVFSGIMGLSLSYIFVAYTEASIVRTLLVTASLYGCMSIYGYTTKRDLTSFGSFLFMGLVGIIIASLVNIFMQSSMLDFVVSVIGVLIFTGFTAYDTQKLKQVYYIMGGTSEVAQKVSIYGALSLYLDFINLFLFLLRFFGDRRN